MKWKFYLKRMLKRLWVRVSLYGLGGVGVAVLAWVLRDVLPDDAHLATGAVDDLLAIISASMLAVATFSISIMVSAYASAASSATPRATSLLIADKTAQSALATFIGAFIFSIVGIIALRFGVYGQSGRLLLFFATIVVIAAIVITLIRWIDHVTTMGRLNAVIDLIEETAAEAITDWMKPEAGCPAAWDGKVKRGWQPELLPEIGYIQHVAYDDLQELAEEAGCEIVVARPAGKLNDAVRPIAFTTKQLTAEQRESLHEAFAIGASRTFDQDPRFGFITLTEVASRALSPAINDPGTAIEIISRTYRLLAKLLTTPYERQASYSRVQAPELAISDVLDDAFTPLARDGAAIVEVGIRLMKAYASLAQLAQPDERKIILAHARTSAARFTRALTAPEDKAIIAQLTPKS